ncbi:hypothetical protein [Mycolicibacterium fortuitum]|uniref:Uncharacterized protein n=1 Tax=Mycolicibacterium fortuitum subsp. fortuitum DSM 46621 = ATCC 6841 = JCM 6387 TaxID=1214102 RepID=K0VDI2_MYCFO|nr:hypothetical protein [Mycolicibacterium fortuitum]AIY44741.1 hypothetical protein G155_03185 [Mycobacterium sp. VKM Ac-1817D]CRL79616.1 hypothetical protein CPGR_02811 [Mycolicibacter nonchromogenicus]EJZ15785.1 hypothetical protein MFORT_02709 [Mycolicibacterium fortuitum subsp. fortuitum DSM 46621 = ATCC 6841 = JCM 6387]WEV33451.1 hypothetical protein OMF10_03270 [Mycolicibacterium fortuitum]CRL54789.1 hypothetical protein CPGR_02086 [Mycolicibacterium fortuitum subsp. fortuitum DSM 46621
MLDLDLAAELKKVLPSVNQGWTFSSTPGWYLSDDDDRLPMYWDGTKWHDPAGDFEHRVVELVTPYLEQIFKQGFTAGYVAAHEESAL